MKQHQNDHYLWWYRLQFNWWWWLYSCFWVQITWLYITWFSRQYHEMESMCIWNKWFTAMVQSHAQNRKLQSPVSFWGWSGQSCSMYGRRYNYMHGITNFFPTDYCDGCGVIHSVSIYDKIVNTVYNFPSWIHSAGEVKPYFLIM